MGKLTARVSVVYLHFMKMRLAVVRLAFLITIGIVAGLLIFPSSQIHAAQTVPYKVNFQGRLTNTTGNVMPDGLYNIKFRLYNVVSGGTVVWSELRETTNRIQVTNGLFSVQLGDVTALSSSLFTSQPLYFEVELPTPVTATCSTAACASFTEGAMTPRQPLASSPYAMNADTLDGIDAPSFARRDLANTFTNTQLFKNSADSIAALSVQNAAGTNVLVIDTTNQRIGVGSIVVPAGTLSVQNASGETLPALVVNNQGTGNVASFQQAGVNVFAISATGSVTIANSANSTAAFVLQRAAGSEVLVRADTTNNRLVVGDATGTDTNTTLLILDSASADPTTNVVNGAMYYNTTTNKFRCRQAGAFADCVGGGAAPGAQTVTLVPEYAGAVLSADGTSNNINVTSNAVSGLISGQGYKHNFYQWDTTAATAQDYDIVLNYQLPSTFTGFVAGSFNIWTYADSLTSTDATFMLKSSTGATCYTSAVSVKPTIATTWQQLLPGDPGNGCTFAANDIITIDIKPTVIQPNTNKLKIGELRFAYQ